MSANLLQEGHRHRAQCLPHLACSSFWK